MVILNLIYIAAQYAINIFSILLIIYILMSWVPASRETKIGKLIGRIAEPYLGFFRKFIPPLGMIDISPIVAIFVLRYLISPGVYQVYSMIASLIR
ncbi:YggT family protein [Sporosarcina oncorhynchi]|uniref:YggT family protein n=1 Tax=Sporosarcina oncorhynchi TaxID=3056444 RepID=A0ABZ0L156_9BACL|nr:YggT family protein [Sporosarcina sp. T2O-4]WOV86183.1 YggT family protein [Sporosarcina sp. T2O-4]